MKKYKLIAVVTAIIMTIGVMTVFSQAAAAGAAANDGVGYSYDPGNEDENECDTCHCVDWANYEIQQDSDYCMDREIIEGNLWGEHSLVFTALEDLEIVSFRFNLYREDPGVSLIDYTLFADMDCTENDEMILLQGSFVGTSPVTVKKGEPLLCANIRADIDDWYFHDNGYRNTVYLAVDELQVKTADGYKVIRGDVDTTEYVPFTTVPFTTEPLIATSSPVSTTAPIHQLIIGDVNGDGAVTVADATQIQRYAAELVTFTPAQMNAADTNGDGKVTVNDATQIQKYLAELIDRLG